MLKRKTNQPSGIAWSDSFEGFGRKTMIPLILSISVAFAGNVYSNTFQGDCTQYTVVEIKQRLDSGQLTSVQCTQQFLDKIAEVDPIDEPRDFLSEGPVAGPNVAWFEWLQQFEGLNLFVFINPNALADAAAADALRASGVDKPLLGVPIAIKDFFPVDGFNNSGGQFQLRGYVAPRNDPTTQALIDAGAIIIGQNNMHELGAAFTGINFAYGPARNPHDPSKIAGGSSGGGAAAVSARLIPAAIGNDLGGSVRQPPALNGIIGFRSSFSRQRDSDSVGYWPNGLDLSKNLVAAGPMTRSIADVVLIDKVMSTDGGVTINPRKRLDGVRIGVPQDFYAQMEPDVREVVKDALAKLEAKGATLVRTPDIPGVSEISPEVPFPGLFSPISSYGLLWLNRFYATIGYDRPQWSQENNIDNAPEAPDVAAQTLEIQETIFPIPTLADAVAFNNDLLVVTEQVRSSYNEYFANHDLDVILYPTTNLPAISIKDVIVEGGDPFINYANTFIGDFFYTTASGVNAATVVHYNANLYLSPTLGTPSLSMPVGLTKGEKLPVGMLIEGRNGDDATVLEIGSAFEHIFGIDDVKNLEGLRNIDVSQ